MHSPDSILHTKSDSVLHPKPDSVLHPKPNSILHPKPNSVLLWVTSRGVCAISRAGFAPKTALDSMPVFGKLLITVLDL